jgi:hypothetical protein
MSTTLQSSGQTNLNWQYASLDQSNIATSQNGSDAYSQSMQAGPGGAGYADLEYHATLNIAANSANTITLSSLSDPFGNAIVFARIKQMQIRVLGTAQNAGSTGGPILVGNAASHAWTGFCQTGTSNVAVGGTAGRQSCLTVQMDDAVALPVTTNVADQVKFTNINTSNPVTVQATFIGSSV